MELSREERPQRTTPLFPRGGGGEGALFGVMAIMSFLACLVLAFALSAARLAHTWERGLSGQATVQIVDTPGVAVETQVAGVMEVLNTTAGISFVRMLSREESEALLKPWLGDADLGAVPVPVLIALTLDPNVQLDADTLRTRLRQVAPGASFDDHSRWNAGLTAASSAVGWTSYAVLFLIAAAAAASVVFAAQAALQAHRDVVDVLHMTGARPSFIAREVQWRFFRLGGEAGLAGLAAAGLCVMIAAALTSRSDAYFMPALSPDWRDALWFVVVPIAAALIAMLTARFAVARFLSKAV